MMIKNACIVVLSCLMVWSVARGEAPAVVKGVVFLDANANGKRDDGEKGLSGVRVTDGVGFAVTGDDGAYSITIAPDRVLTYAGARVVSVSWPSGMWPSGQWWARLDQLADATRVDFALREDKQSLPFAFLHMSDDHGGGWAYKNIAPRVKELGGLLKFCFNTGDMGYAGPDNAESMFTGLKKIGQEFPVPMFFTPGNHDMVKQVERGSGPLAGAGGFTKYLGPIRWSFDYAGVHFASIDWWDPDIKEHVEGSAPPIAAAWLDKDLSAVKPGTRTILLVHFPSGCKEYFDVIARHKVAQAFGGHNHRHAFYDYAGVAAVTTVNPETSGSGNLCVVTQDAIDVVFYCNGGKGGPNYHGKLCGLSASWNWKDLIVPKGTPDKTLSAAAVSLDGGTRTLDAGSSQGVNVVAEFAPGTAKRVGLRFGASSPVEVVFTGQSLVAGGAPIPFVLLPSDAGTVRLQVTIGGGLMTLRANNRIRMAKPKAVSVTNPAAVTLFAEGGKAEFKKVDVTALK
ncbi:MAG: metallophosphoesterase [Planctomycetaceae bacterium]|nr:metallophosphoesterase [Planctomycetaceae bacterium]